MICIIARPNPLRATPYERPSTCPTRTTLPNPDPSRRSLADSLRKARAAKHARLRPRQLRCEPLEDRRLLSVFTYANTTALAIPDKGTVTSPDHCARCLHRWGPQREGQSSTHTRDPDLDVFLIAPDGTRVELFTDVGTTKSQNFTNTVLDDAATSRSPSERLRLPARSGPKGT